MRVIVLVVLGVFISACIALPATRESKTSECELVTREMYIETRGPDLHELMIGTGSTEELVVIAAGLLIYSVSWVVSGSIVLVGNTIHWIESKGKCSEQGHDIIQINEADNLACSVESGQCAILK
jgi:hypothetical protein